MLSTEINPIIAELARSLKGNLPGKPAQQKMSVQPRVIGYAPYPEEKAIPSAVLILLFPSNKGLSFFLTERTRDVEHHKGQVALPGGGWEPGEQLDETALRETWEEIGIDFKAVTIIGALTPLFLPITGYRIHPFLGWTPQEPDVTADPTEVANIFTVPLSSLLDETNQSMEHRKYKGVDLKVPYFQFGDYKVWGATSMILSEFKTLLRDVENA